MHGGLKPLERFILYLFGSVIALELLAAILPRVLVPLVVVATVVVVLRLTWFFTNRY